MIPKRAYVMYCAAILQSNERIKKKIYQQLWGTERWRETSLIVKMASLDLSLQLSLHLIKFSLSVLWMLSNLDRYMYVDISLAIILFIHCSNM